MRRSPSAAPQEGGRVARLTPPDYSTVPAARDLGSQPDPLAAATAAGDVLGAELRASNIDMDFAPVMDVDTNPANPVIGTRSFSRDAGQVSAMGTALAAALQAQGVAACAKHFPGHGDTSVDSHIDLPVLTHDLQRLKVSTFHPRRRQALSRAREMEVPPCGLTGVRLGHPSHGRRSSCPLFKQRRSAAWRR